MSIYNLVSGCPLVWMMHNRPTNNKINCIHVRVIRILYKDNFSTFENLLEKEKAVKINVRNLQLLLTNV